MNEADVLAKYLTLSQLEDVLAEWIAVLDTEEDESIMVIREAIKLVRG